MIDHGRLLELLDYCPITGLFTRRISLSNQTKVGEVAGNLNRGYVELFVDGTKYCAHRLAWFYVNEVWPSARLDHKDLNRSNNAIGNLREATQSQNGANTLPRKRNTLGLKGVTRHGGRFRAQIMVKRKQLYLGIFDTPQEAAQAYDRASVLHYGEFALTNQKLGNI